MSLLTARTCTHTPHCLCVLPTRRAFLAAVFVCDCLLGYRGTSPDAIEESMRWAVRRRAAMDHEVRAHRPR